MLEIGWITEQAYWAQRHKGSSLDIADRNTKQLFEGHKMRLRNKKGFEDTQNDERDKM